ncbi:glutathione S-transferase family protein [Pseudomonas huanghezhanensis]|uniref:glutathione S-transferase family protein n=1 Tax=Pseudomonas huanghezhanensis TaxID=3002903 RepID=UPI002285D9F7|nr:glutathione S-transferase [Pseudomonas sp. BSw22131]
MNRQPIKFYRAALSGHCHRVQLMMSLLGLEYDIIEVDLANGEHRRQPFLSMNSFGQVPVIDDNGQVFADANAILVYLAIQYGGRQWLPEDPVGAAQVQRWLSAAAGPLAYELCRARLVTVFDAPYAPAPLIAASHALLAVMEQELTSRDWLAGDTPTLADIANYAYVAHGPEGNVSLQPYPNVRAWLEHVEALPGFTGMGKSVAGLRA